MGMCKLCERSGFFFPVSPIGLCQSCAPVVNLETDQALRIISESEKLVNTSKKFETRLGRCDDIVIAAQRLLQFEERGIAMLNVPPSKIIAQALDRKNTLVVEYARELCDDAKRKALTATSSKARAATFTKALVAARNLAVLAGGTPEIHAAITLLGDDVHRATFESFVEEAKKAEFKGNKKRALDQYLEALYFLRTDDLDDILQAEKISGLEKRITTLGGTVPVP